MALTFKTAGVTFEGRQDIITCLKTQNCGLAKLVREPDNEHDRNAISVMVPDVVSLVDGIEAETMDGDEQRDILKGRGAWVQLGYVPAALATVLAPAMDTGMEFVARIVRCPRSDMDDCYGAEVGINPSAKRVPKGGQEMFALYELRQHLDELGKSDDWWW